MFIKRLILTFLTVVSMTCANDVNLDQLVEDAKKANKHILVYLHTPGCPYCDKMQEFTLEDDTVNENIQKDLIFVDINVKDAGNVAFDGFNDSKLKFAKKIGYNVYPSCLFFDQNGDLVYDEVGYKEEDNFLKTLQMVSSKAYNDIE